MTMPHERTRAVLQTRDFLLEISRDQTLSEKIRHDAKFLLRHYPSEFDLKMAGRIEESVREFPIGTLGPIFSSHVDNS
ncbi:BPSL0761 family protein [Pseudomonas panipatensis]|uniref:BPSL0761 family protein n=1 Tax=Pseudomonas panipatensis TaxID=428992 RepID=UPI000B7DC125|nr:BPSL0761 family protein [Pseudomonas panipatensis]